MQYALHVPVTIDDHAMTDADEVALARTFAGSVQAANGLVGMLTEISDAKPHFDGDSFLVWGEHFDDQGRSWLALDRRDRPEELGEYGHGVAYFETDSDDDALEFAALIHHRLIDADNAVRCVSPFGSCEASAFVPYAVTAGSIWSALLDHRGRVGDADWRQAEAVADVRTSEVSQHVLELLADVLDYAQTNYPEHYGHEGEHPVTAAVEWVSGQRGA